MPNARDRAQAILAELRKLLPDKAAELDAIARKLRARNRDCVSVGVTMSASLAKFDGIPKPGDQPVEVVNLGVEKSCR